MRYNKSFFVIILTFLVVLGVNFDANAQTLNLNLQGIDFSSDGTQMYVLSGSTNSVYQFELSNPYDLTSFKLINIISIQSEIENPVDIELFQTGNVMLILESNKIHSYNLELNHDISTANYHCTFPVHEITPDGPPNAISLIKNDRYLIVTQGGTYLQVFTVFTQKECRYTITSQSDKVKNENTEFVDFKASTDGQYALIADEGNNSIRQFEYTGNPFGYAGLMDTGFSFSVSEYVTKIKKIEFSNDGTNMFVIGTTENDVIHQFALNTPFYLNAEVRYVGTHALKGPPSAIQSFEYEKIMNGVHMFWQPPKWNGGYELEGYKVYYVKKTDYNSQDIDAFEGPILTRNTNQILSGLEGNTEYSVQIIPQNQYVMNHE